MNSHLNLRSNKITYVVLLRTLFTLQGPYKEPLRLWTITDPIFRVTDSNKESMKFHVFEPQSHFTSKLVTYLGFEDKVFPN